MADDNLEKRVRDLEKFRDEVNTGRKVFLWVLAAIGATVIFMLTVVKNIKDITK